ncbi:TonB-dependent receptor [Methylocystis sp. Sn-Cys]|uniref:TonB-dependent receptor n=1 Tax=Methylocystis sp. Sn-Cys TaxID=1701263 RepID=UPI0019225CD4|nr:TonB-dependent receptor [Methylocystis sp. Sn-Cys]MBL1255655.1 TonB-dependent receptor [Methylocystis sp. Sn-Cys]
MMRRSLIAAIPLCFAHTITSVAQTLPAEEARVPEVVISAPKTTADLSERQATAFQTTPQAATVITKQQIDALQISNLLQAQKLEPSLQIRFADVRSLTVNVRGFGSSTSVATDGIFGGVPIYVDGIYQPRPGQAIFDIPDLVGVDVLKGPQGTKGGMDGTGGAVYLNTAAPSFERQQKVEVSAGNYSNVQVRGSATGPIADSDKLAFRLSFASVDRDGYVSSYYSGQKYNDWHNKSVRAQFVFLPTNDLSVRLIADYSHVHQACCPNVLNGVVANYANGAVVPNNLYARLARLNYVPTSFYNIDSYKGDISGYLQNTQQSYGVAAIVGYNAGGYEFSSLTSFRGWNFDPLNQTSSALAPVRTTNSNNQIAERSLQQEFKVSTPANGPIEGTAGLFYLFEQLYDWGYSSYGPAAGGWYGSPANSIAFNDIALNNLASKSYDNPRSHIIAPYARAVWHATPDLDFTFGLRYSYAAKSTLFRQYQFAANSLDGLAGAQQAAARSMRIGLIGADREFNATTRQGLISALASASYKISSDTLAYATYARGGRAGGPNPIANLPTTASTTVRPEELDDYEIGLKTTFFERRFLANVAAFIMVDRNYITNITDISGARPITYLSNAKRAISRGVEFDLRASPVEGLTTYGSVTYNHTYYGSFENAPCPFELGFSRSCSLTGRPISLTPRWALAVGGEYAHDIGRVFEPIEKSVVAYFGADFSYQTKFFSVPDDSIYSIIDAYGLLNLHAGLRLTDERVDLSGWVHNVTNKHYFTTVSPNFTAGGVIGTPADPIMAGFTLKAKF